MYLRSSLAEEAPEDPVGICPCGHGSQKWRCKNCSGGRLLCGLCCRNAHQFLPFHRVEYWNSRYFQMGALWQVGLRLYLGHQGNPCPAVTNRDGQDDGISGRSNYFIMCLPAGKTVFQIRGKVMTAGPQVPLPRTLDWRATSGAIPKFLTQLNSMMITTIRILWNLKALDTRAPCRGLPISMTTGIPL